MWYSEENIKVKNLLFWLLILRSLFEEPCEKKNSYVRSNMYVKVVFDYYKQRKLLESGDICLKEWPFSYIN